MRSEWDGVKHVATLLQTGSSLHDVSKKSHVSFRAFGPLRDVKSLWNLVAAAVQSYPVGRAEHEVWLPRGIARWQEGA